ncbi:hypothetical protein HX891_21375 [Pseudomonas reactans]|uniref:hypothetical protein n=1 Tax=Pseudomonas reactans TaxID=117680 RepID=UPI0015B9403E|nr:hypothetical protein [Pseudomonas reactans]NWD82940.1 hypothetical protein [Pseudomonas reactans]
MAKKPIPKKNAPSRVKGNAQPTSLPALAKAPEMPYAELEHVQGGSLLDPLDGKNGIKAKVFPPTGSTGRTFHWKLKDYPHPEFSPLDVPSDKDEVTVPPDWISRCIALTVLYWYEAFVNGVHHKSLVGELFVQSLREDQTEDSLPELPQVVEESNTRWLKMQSFDGDAIVQFEAPPMPVEGMRLYVVAVGDEHHANPAFIWLEFGRPITVEEANPNHVFEYKLWRWWLARREDWSSITISLAWLYHGNPGEFDTSDPFNHRYLPKNGEDFHSRYTTLLRVDPRLDLLPPHLIESTLCGDGEYVLNPINSKYGGIVKATYEGMTKGDVVCAYVFGEGFPSVPLGCITLQGAETEALFNLPAWIIAAFFEKTLKLTFSVQFGSNPAQTSPEREVKVLAPKLTTPFIEQATGGTLSLKTFSDDATACVPIWDYAAVGQCVWVWITGTLEDGGTYLFYILMDEPLTSPWLANGIDAPISRAELQKLQDCSDFKLHAAVSFDGKCDLATAFEFPVQRFNIEQEDLVLDAPDVLEAVGNQLTIYNARNGMTVRVAYTRISGKHQIQLNVKRADGTSIPILPLPGDSNRGYVDFPIDRTEAIHASGKTLTINYTVTSACKIQTSKDLDLDVSEPVRLTTPEVAQATPPATQGGILDLRTFGADADIGVPDWWFMLTGQRGWLKCSGKLWNGSIYTFKVMDAELITNADVTNGLSRVLKRLELDNYETGTELTFVFELTVDGDVDENKAITFPALKLILRRRLNHQTGFDPADRGWNGWQRGYGARDPKDLALTYGSYLWGTGYWLTNWGWTDTSNPATESEILYIILNLEAGRTYDFSGWVREDLPATNLAQMVLTVDGVRVTPVTAAGPSWVLLSGVITPAVTGPVRLGVHNVKMGIGPDNDFRVTWLRIIER